MFDDTRLDDAEALRAVDTALRHLATAGARVRVEAGAAHAQVESLSGVPDPRAVVAAGRDARLVRAVLEPTCPVPFVAWDGPGLPGWAGALDLVVVLAQDEGDAVAVTTVVEAVRRGCGLVVACPQDSVCAASAVGRDSVVLPTTSNDPLAGAVLLLNALHAVRLGPRTDAEEVASALDDVAVRCSPYRDIANNPAKELTLAVGGGSPLLWGGSVLAARAARRVSEAFRHRTGRVALAAEAESLLPLIERAPPRDLFADPYDGGYADRACLVVLDDGATAPVVEEQRRRLADACERRDVRLDVISGGDGSQMARYAVLLTLGGYAAVYLGLALAATASPGETGSGERGRRDGG